MLTIFAPHSLDYSLKRLAQNLQRTWQERLSLLGLTPFHWVVLSCLWQEDGLPTSTIAEQLQQVGGTLTGVLDRMEERGLVERVKDAQDRRIWRIWLTAEGLQLREVIPPIVMEVREAYTRGVSPREYQLFVALLDQMIDNLR